MPALVGMVHAHTYTSHSMCDFAYVVDLMSVIVLHAFLFVLNCECLHSIYKERRNCVFDDLIV